MRDKFLLNEDFKLIDVPYTLHDIFLITVEQVIACFQVHVLTLVEGLRDFLEE